MISLNRDHENNGTGSKITDLQIEEVYGCNLGLTWCSVKGFGEMHLEYDPETQKLYCGSEYMSRQHVKDLLCMMVDACFMEHEDEYKVWMEARCKDLFAKHNTTWNRLKRWFKYDFRRVVGGS